MRFGAGFGVAIVATFAASSARAEPHVYQLRHDTRVNVAVTATGASWLILTELLKPSLVPEKCRWCYRAEDGGDLLNPYDGWMRKRLLWNRTRRADIASSVVVGFIEPTMQLGLLAMSANREGAISAFPLDSLIVAESTVIAAVINQVAKFGFARERPFVHYLPRAPEALRELTSSPSDDNLSFFSGHTTAAFALATSSATVASLRGYRLAPLLWGTGLTLAASVGYLRIAADKHYLSDVLTGALVGSIVGVGMPLLFHSRKEEPSSSGSSSALTLPAVRPAFAFSGMF
ncbi:MAG TPA: phosphatase PAP2 family protein [Polyangiaceae bacterium]|nr:phosphatase PAP2 family protein [Polyangiaceae bacterium]